MRSAVVETPVSRTGRSTNGPDGEDRPLTWREVEGWVERGLIRPDQLAAIRAASAGGDADEAGGPAKFSGVDPKARPGFNATSVAYYFGGFMILLAYTFFMGLQWENLGRGGQLAVALVSVAGLWAIGDRLRRAGYRLGGNVLIFAGTGVFPLVVYAALRLLNLWPDDADADPYRDFHRRISGTWLLLEGVSILVTLAVLWVVRFPLLTLLLAFWGWYLSMDLVAFIANEERWAWDTTEWLVGGAVGLAMLVLGVWLRRQRGDQEYSRWFYLFGHVALLGNAVALALDEGVALGLLFLLLYVGVVAASVWLQSRMFLVFGALGCYASASYLAFDVFAGALGFVFSLAAIGLLVVLSTVAYQRYLHRWLVDRLHPLDQPSPPAAA